MAEVLASLKKIGGNGGGGKLIEGSYPCKNCSPIMTSNTAPSGTVSASNSASGYAPWQAMKGIDTANADRWVTNGNVEDAYIQYAYPTPVVINRIEFKNRPESRRTADTAHDCQIKIQGSHNGTSFDDLGTFDELATEADYIKIHVFDNTTAYTYYRIQFVGYNTIYSNSHYCGLSLLQMYQVQNYDISTNETVLWTNPSPTANFAGQTVTLSDNINNYRYIGVLFDCDVSASGQPRNTAIYSVADYKTTRYNGNTDHNICSLAFQGKTNNYMYTRMFYYVDDTHIGVSSGMNVQRTGGFDSVCVPFQIIGIK